MEKMSRSSAPLRYKIIAYVAVWILALCITDPTLKYWALAYMFPLGLARFVLPPGTTDSGWAVMASCVGIYLVQGVLFFRSRNIRWIMFWFAILIGLLVVNIAGCRDMIHAH